MTDMEKIFEEREGRYGKFSDNARVAQELKKAVFTSIFKVRSCPYHREAVEQICSKLSRIACGDPDYADNWDDIAGYALRVSEILKKGSQQTTYASDPAVKLPPLGYDPNPPAGEQINCCPGSTVREIRTPDYSISSIREERQRTAEAQKEKARGEITEKRIGMPRTMEEAYKRDVEGQLERDRTRRHFGLDPIGPTLEEVNAKIQAMKESL